MLQLSVLPLELMNLVPGGVSHAVAGKPLLPGLHELLGPGVVGLRLLLDEDMDGVAHEQRQRLQTIDEELEDVKKQLGRVWNFVAKSDSVDVAEASDLIVELRERKEKLEVAAEEARGLFSERRQFLDSADTVATFAAEMRDFLKTSELTETRAFVHSFVKEIEVKPAKAAIVYSIPTTEDSPLGGADTAELARSGRVRSTVNSGPPNWTKSRTFVLRFRLEI